MSSNRRLRFKEADVSRDVKGALKAGLDVGRVEIDASGRIVLMAKGAAESVTSELDDWMNRNASKA